MVFLVSMPLPLSNSTLTVFLSWYPFQKDDCLIRSTSQLEPQNLCCFNRWIQLRVGLPALSATLLLQPCCCLCGLSVTVWPAPSSSILISTPSDSKVSRAGARSAALEEGKMARESERAREAARFLSPLGNVVEALLGCQKGKRALNIGTSPSPHGHVTCLNSFGHEKRACPSFTFSWLWVTQQICSQVLKDAVEILSSPQTMHKSCQWFARWTEVDGPQTLWGFLKHTGLFCYWGMS